MTTKTELWQKILAGDETVDFFDLAGLIPTNASESFLWEQFGTLPHASSMIGRILELQRENRIGHYITPDPKNHRPQAEIEKLALVWRNDVRKFVTQAHEEEYIGDLSDDRTEWMYDNTKFVRTAQNWDFPISNVSEYLGDLFIDYQEVKKPWGYALEEAVLHLTTYPAITRYILEDVVGFPMKSRSYYELWRAGGDVIFMKGYMVVLCEAGPG